jgi:hypothetical protein
MSLLRGGVGLLKVGSVIIIGPVPQKECLLTTYYGDTVVAHCPDGRPPILRNRLEMARMHLF